MILCGLHILSQGWQLGKVRSNRVMSYLGHTYIPDPDPTQLLNGSEWETNPT